MQKTLILLATLSLIPTPILALTTPFKQEIIIAQANPATIAQKITVKVKAGKSSASGTLISRNGDRYTLLTNAHVVSRGKPYRIITPDGKEHTAKLLKTGQSFQGDDLALLEFSSKNNYTVAEWADLNTLKQGDSVYSVGFAIGKKDLNITKGEITLMTPQPLLGGYQIGFSNNTEQGMSGGGLLNSEGKLIGILGLGSLSILNDAYQYKDGTEPPQATLELMQRSSFAIPATTATLFAQNNTKPPTNTAQQKKPATEKTTKKPYTGIVKKIDDIAQAVTVRIDSQNNGNGSGVIINKQGDTYYVLTAHHVIKNSDKYTITTPDGQVYKPKEIITVSKDNDLAVVKFQSKQNYQMAQIANYLPEFQWLFVSGFPGSDSSKQRLLTAGRINVKSTNFLDGIVKDLSSLQQGRELVYTSNSFPGMSGGPVLDLEGRLVGINTGAENETILSDKDVQEINFGYALGVPITTFLGLASRANIPTEQLKVSGKVARQSQVKQTEEIKAQLFNFREPSNNAPAKDWLDYGNELWRSEQFSKSVIAFDRAIELLTGKSTTAEKEQLAIAYFGKGLALSNNINFVETSEAADTVQFKAALEAFQKVTTIEPRFELAWIWQVSIQTQLKQYPEALQSIQKAIEIFPKNSILYMLRGSIFVSIERYQEAITSLDEFIKRKPSNPIAYLTRSMCYFIAKKQDLILPDLNQAIKVDPNFAISYLARGAYYNYGLKDKDKANADFQQFLSLSQQETIVNFGLRGAVYMLLKDQNKAIAYLQKASDLAEQQGMKKIVKQMQELKKLSYYNKGNAYANLEQYEKAIADYSKAIEIDPKYTLAYINRGLAYANLKQYDKAIADYSQAIKLDPKDPGAYNNRGLAYSNIKQYDKAIADYNQAILLDPKYSGAYNNRGNIYLELKQYDKAIADYNQAILLDPKLTQAYNGRGVVYYNLKQYDKAIVDYSQAINLDPKYTDAYNNRGVVYKELKQYDKAIADYSKAIEIDPKYTLAYNNRGLVYFELKQYTSAIADYSKAIEIDPKYTDAYNNRGVVYKELKQYDKAIADYSKAIEIDPKYTLAYNNRGLVYFELKQYTSAIADYEQVLVLDKNNNLPATVNIGLLKYEIGEVQVAIKYWQKAIEIDANSAEPQLALATAMYGQGDKEKAMKLAQDALRLEPAFATPEHQKLNNWGDKLIADTQKMLLEVK